VSHPAGLPDLFIDRSLGRKKVPTILRSVGLRLRTLAEVYGVPADQGIQDVEWLERAGTEGWAVFMKDAAIATNPAEIAAVKEFAVRCFTLARQDIAAHRMAAWFLNSLDDIVLACGQPGPFVYAVEETRITLLA
jgi:hypothetical protein